MSKAVLISIKPEWCEFIVSGCKTIEVRKTRPKLERSFKCYIYCTLGGICFVGDKRTVQGNGKVIGEFMCHDISEYETEFYPPDKQPIYESITEWNADNEVWEAVASNNDTYPSIFLIETCMNLEDFRTYLGVGENKFYGWHISDLVIYDEPRELSDFFVKGFCSTEECEKCKYHDGIDTWCLLPPACDDEGIKPLFKAPQSWCYVEESDNV